MAIAFMGPPDQWQAELDLIYEQALLGGDVEKQRECSLAQQEIDLLHQPSTRVMQDPTSGSLIFVE